MTATFDIANDEILTLFKTAWDPTGHIALYPNTAGKPPSGATPWARVNLAHLGGGQSSLHGDENKKRYERNGLLTVQVFVPTGEGLSRAYDLGKIIADAYEGKTTPSQVWFRDVSINEIGPDGSWFQVNVVVNFTYDEVK